MDFSCVLEEFCGVEIEGLSASAQVTGIAVFGVHLLDRSILVLDYSVIGALTTGNLP